MNAIRADEVPAVVQRAAPQKLYPDIGTFAELDAYVLKRIADFSADVDDDETAQHIGRDAQQRSRGRLAMLSEIRLVIREAVAAEARVDASEAVEQQYKDLDPVDDALEIRRLNGDR